MNNIEEIKKEFEHGIMINATPKEIWEAIEQAITKSNEEAVREFVELLKERKEETLSDEVVDAGENGRIIQEAIVWFIDDTIKTMEQYLTQKESDEDN